MFVHSFDELNCTLIGLEKRDIALFHSNDRLRLSRFYSSLMLCLVATLVIRDIHFNTSSSPELCL